MTNPTPKQRIAFANGLAHLLLKYATLTRKEKVYVERVRDARTIEELHAICLSAPAYAYATFSTSVSAIYAAYACEQAIKAGVPEAQVRALRALTLGV